MSRERRLGLLLAAFVVLVAPLAGGQTTSDLIWTDGQEGELMRWPTESLSDGSNAASITGNSTFLKLSPLESAINQSLLFVDIWVVPTFRSTSDGVWNYSFEATLNGVGEWSSCWAHVATIQAGGVLAGDLITSPSVPFRCDTAVTVDLDEEPEFTWWLNRTVESGSPDEPLEQHVSIKMDRGEFVVYPMDLNITNLETYLPIVLFLVLVAWSLWNGWLLPALAATLGVLGSYMDIGVAEVGAMFLFLLFLWLQYYRDKVTMLQERGLK